MPYVDLATIRLPRLVPVRQIFEAGRISDIRGTVHAEFEKVGAGVRIKPRQRIAITAGSRGIARIAEITRAVVDEVKGLGAQPFIVPAMGSHGGATAEGQREMVESFGITAEAMGCPILSSMEAVALGQTESGYTVYCDRLAYESDGIIVLNRVKPHSILTGDQGSGLMKMLGIGLGKAVGADAIHVKGVVENLRPAARLVLANAPVAFGVAIVENSFDEPFKIEAVPPAEIEAADRRLLREARSYLPNIPYDPIDVLIVEWMGKNISGAGIDPNVVGMHRRIGGAPEREIRRIVVLDLTPESHGNAIGVGMADIITERLKDKIDYRAMYVNALTSDFLWGIKIPIALPTDQEAVAVALKPFAPETVRLVRIRDTAHLDTMWISEALLAETGQNPRLEIAGEPSEMAFDREGRLT